MSSSRWIRSPRVGQAIRRHTSSSPSHYYQHRASPPPPQFTSYRIPCPHLTSNSSPLLPSPARQTTRPSTTPPGHRSMSSDSAVENIRNDLHDFKHDKWGWVIYRCTYTDDDAWSRFQQLIHEQSRRTLSSSDVSPEVADAVEWTFVSDPTTLDGASRDQLRRRFRDWAAQAEAVEQPRAAEAEAEAGQRHWTGLRSQRYMYFIQVDEESLRSVVGHGGGGGGDLDAGWVNLVRADEDQDFDRSRDTEDVEAPDGDEGWMVIASHLIGPEFYDAIGQMPEYWYTYYTPPPNLVAYC